VQAVRAARAHPLVEVLQATLDLGHGVGIEQLAQLGVADELAELRVVDGQRLGPALGERGVALVEVLGDHREEDGRSEGRGSLGLVRDDPDAPPRDAGQGLVKRGHVEHVAQALAVGLQDDGE